MKWLRDEEEDDLDGMLEPEELITEAVEELKLAVDELSDIQRIIETGAGVES